jgi:hypothetical protein
MRIATFFTSFCALVDQCFGWDSKETHCIVGWQRMWSQKLWEAHNTRMGIHINCEYDYA